MKLKIQEIESKTVAKTVEVSEVLEIPAWLAETESCDVCGAVFRQAAFALRVEDSHVRYAHRGCLNSNDREKTPS